MFEFGEYSLIVAERVLRSRSSGLPVPLTQRAFDTLVYLVAHRGQLVDKAALLQAVWPNLVVEENNLSQSIAALRRALGDGQGDSRYIVTVPGRGYQWVAPVIDHSGTQSSDAVKSVGDEAPGAPTRSNTTRWRAAWVGLPILLLATVVAVWLMRTKPTDPPDFSSVLPPVGSVLADGQAPQVSPDGRHVVFPATDAANKTLLYVRTRGSAAVRPLPDTDNATLPFWSPDSQRLGFFSGGSLKTIQLSGGRSQTLATAPNPVGGSWSSQGVIIFLGFPNSPPQLVAASGGTVKSVAIAEPLKERRWFPSFLPDGHHYLYLSIDGQTGNPTAIRVASIDSIETRELLPAKTAAVYAPGFLLYRREKALVAQPFDAQTLQLSGQPGIVAENIGVSTVSYQGYFSASSNGVLAYLEADPGSQLVWFDRTGRRGDVAAPIGQYFGFCLSADERQVVYALADNETGNIDIWSRDLLQGSTTRLSFDAAVDFYPVCNPSRNEVAYSTLRLGPPSLVTQDLTKPGAEKIVYNSGRANMVSDWSRDGRALAFANFNPQSSWDVWRLPLLDGSAPVPIVVSPAEDRGARWSPDGKWLAYSVRENGQADVFAVPFPTTGAKWQVSHGGGSHPQWSADQTELFYLAPDQKLFSIDVALSSGGITFGAPHPITAARVAVRGQVNNPYAVTRDGKRFLINSSGDTVIPLTLVHNWTSALRK
jgi:DNA-binding winged helix-turn-helix (wHTH) protein/Tol biopolymer transport system component